MVIIIICVGCSSSNKPSEEEMKNIILQLVISRTLLNNNIDNFETIKYDKFHITNEFVSKTPGGGEESSPYCVEVDYIISWKIGEDNKTKIKNLQKIIDEYPGLLSNKERLNEIEQLKKMPDKELIKQEEVGNNKRFSFEKKGDKWYGGQGWK